MAPPKVLHIVENLDRGAVENWLVRTLRYARAKNIDVDWTFYCALGRAGSLDDEARALDARVIYSPVPMGRIIAFARALRDEVRKGGYDVVHAHHDLVSGLYFLASAGLPVGLRINHIHNADEVVPTENPVKKALMRSLFRKASLVLADRILGISHHTLDTYLQGRRRRPGRDIVHYCSVDATPFQNIVPDRAAFRRALGLPDDALILLFAGRVVPEKGPVFAVDVLKELRKREPRAVMVCAGAGSLEEAMAVRASELGVSEAVRMLGWRKDVANLMAHSDWFILPHVEEPMEGLGLAIVEAQVAGLHLLFSKGIADDALLPSSSWRRLGLAEGASAWADAAMDMLHQGAPSPAAARQALAASPFAMDTALADLLRLHRA